MALQVQVNGVSLKPSTVPSSSAWRSSKQSVVCVAGDYGFSPRVFNNRGLSLKVKCSSDATATTTVTLGQVTEVCKDTFWPIVEAAGDKTVVVDMYTQWCGPCKVIAPKFQELSKNYNDVVFLKLDCNQDNRGLQTSRNHSAVVRAQLNEVAVGGSSNDAATPITQSEEVKSPSETSSATSVSEESISNFISQVSSLVKLVDSRDVVELHLKQLDCEILIRKKEALPQPPPPAHTPLLQSYHVPSVQFSPPPPAPAPAPAAPPVQIPAPSPAAAKPSDSSVPPLKCPMAGTFYRSPGPGEPPIVKVGDKVQKGQVLCIIEAMKLMNEIEADQSGTIIDIFAEDGKSVSVDMPLFVIKP